MQFGHYEVIGELARGAQGAVLHARDSQSGQTVAIKYFFKTHAKALRRFETEVASLSRLQHPNLVQIYDWGEDSRGAWFAQELIEGKSLQAQLRRWGSFPVDEALRIVRSLARALAHAHEAGVLHRDVKPDNVLLRPDGEPVLVDFGLARDLRSDQSRLTQDGQFFGSPGYWAPEQAMGKLEQIGPRTDVYGLGATLYALLCGHPPIEGTNLVEYCSPERFRAVTPLPDRNREVRPALWEVCARCLAYEPEDRFASAEAVAQALARMSETGIATAPQTASRAPGGVALALVLALGVGVALWQAPSESGGRVAVEPGRPTPVDPASVEPEDLQLEALFARADTAFAAKDYARVLALLEEVEERAHDDWRLWNKRAVTYVALERLAEARAAFERGYAYEPRDFKLLNNYAHLCMLTEDFVRGHECLAQMAEQRPGDADVLFDLADVLHELGRSREAERVLGRCLVLDATGPRAWSKRAHVRARLHDWGGAMRDLQQALERDPRRARDWRLATQIHFERQRFDETVAAADRALALDPRPLKTRELRARALLLLGRTDAGLEELDRLIRLAPGVVDFRKVRVTTLLKRKAWKEALADLDAILMHTPDDPRALARRGLAYLSLEEMSKAVTDLRRVVELQPRNPTAFATLGAGLLGVGDIPQALKALDRALALDPTLVLGYRNRAAAHLRRGAWQAAREDLERARSLDPSADDAALARMLGYALTRLGEFDAAEPLLRRVQELDPDDPRAGSALGLIASGRGAHAEAVELCASAVERDPGLLWLWSHLVQVQLAAGQLPEARESLARAAGLAHNESDREELARLRAALEAAGAKR